MKYLIPHLVFTILICSASHSQEKKEKWDVNNPSGQWDFKDIKSENGRRENEIQQRILFYQSTSSPNKSCGVYLELWNVNHLGISFSSAQRPGHELQ